MVYYSMKNSTGIASHR